MGISASKGSLSCFGVTWRKPVQTPNTLADTSDQHHSFEKPAVPPTSPGPGKTPPSALPSMAPKSKAKLKPKISHPIAPLPTIFQPTTTDLGSTPVSDDGPVSSRTRNGGKKKALTNAILPPLAPFPPVHPPDVSTPPAFPLPGLGLSSDPFGTLAINNDTANDDWTGALLPVEFWAANGQPPPVKQSGKKNPGRLNTNLAGTSGLQNCTDRLYRPGDEDLAVLTLPSGYTDYASTRTVSDASPRSSKCAEKAAAEEGEESRSTASQGSAAEQEDIQRFMSGEAEGLVCMCRKPLVPNAAALMRLARTWLYQTRSLAYTADCQHCDRSTCVECGAEDIPVKHKCARPKHGQPPSAYFIVWILLCGLDEHVLVGVASSGSSTKSAKRKRKGAAHSTAWASGVGYGGSGGDGWGDSSDSVSGDSYGSTDETERCVEKALTELSKRLPDLLNETHMLPLTLPMLQRSRLQLSLARHLENDSLHSISKDTSTYSALLKIVEGLLAHEETQSLVLDPQIVYSAHEGLLHWTYGDRKARAHSKTDTNKNRIEAESSPESRESLLTALCRLNKICTLFESNVDRNNNAASDKGAKEMLKVCKLLSDVVAKAQNVSDASAAHIEEQPAGATTEDDWFRSHCLLDVLDGSITGSKEHPSQYHFTTNANAIAKPRPGRIKHLLTEMVMLKTSLPPGIFVRHEASRLDILKVIIIGPKGTPYENGAFEFDMYCPDSYPHSPPLVQFRQTGGGTESMNPNLYPDGKVCLSLLGTWQGTPWQPGTSTLLQVLLSLQGMVFCDEPYYNEPGWSSHKNDAQSKSYNRNLYRATARVAIASWLDALEGRQNSRKANKTKAEDDIWHDVLLHHFATNASDIVRTLTAWEADIATARREAEAAAKQAAAAAAKANKMLGNTGPNAAASIPPPPMQNHWGMNEHGKEQLSNLLPKIEKALGAVVEGAMAAGVIPASTPVESERQPAVKSPAELTTHSDKAEEEEELEGNAKRTRSKRRKTGKEA